MTKFDTVKLATGADLPLFGLGTWQSIDPVALTAALKTALDAGYPLIDTAYAHHNEVIIGKVLQEYFTSGKLKREDIFITTKLPPTAHKSDEIEAIVRKQLKNLQVDYFDLYLIHSPCPCKHRPNDTPDNYKVLLENGHVVPALIDHLETWKMLENLYKKGMLKAIGLSNFNKEQIQNILDHATVKPHNLQVEVHLYWPQKELHEFCKKNNITMTSYATLGSPGRAAFVPMFYWPSGEPMKDPLVLQMAEKYKKTPAQICIFMRPLNFDFILHDILQNSFLLRKSSNSRNCSTLLVTKINVDLFQILLRHMTQRGICVIPKSINPDRIRENFSIFDFKLTQEEMKQLESVKTRVRLFLFDMVFDHPWYPFKDVDLSKMKRVYLTKTCT